MLEGKIMELKEKLVKLRMERKMSQGELAAKVGVTRQAVSRWERGVAAPSTEKLIALSRLYDVPVERLVGGNLECQKKPAAAVAVEDVPPENEEAPRKRGWKIAAGAVLAACLLLVTVAAVITIWSAVSKEPEEPKDSVIRTEDMEWEDIDPAEVQDWTDTTVTIEE